MDPTVRDAVLQDPKVQQAVKTAGHDALANPEVQKQILEVCRRRFPEIAAGAQAKIKEWATDPEVQRQAYAYAGLAAEYTQQAVGRVTNLIQQGPAGLRVLAFAAGVACCVNAALFLFGVLNPASAVSQLVEYVLHGYLIAFALTTMLFEAKPEWIEMISGLNMYQNMLLDKAEFLSEVLGRGLFYGFQGTLWLSFASFSALQNYALGLWLLLVAMFHICMHFGVMPHEVVAKFQIRESGYMPLPKDEEACQHLLEPAPCAEEAAQAFTEVVEERTEARSARSLLPSQPEERPASPPPAASLRPASARPTPTDDAEERLLRALQDKYEPPKVNSARAENNADSDDAPFEPILGRWQADEDKEPAEICEAKKKSCCLVQ